MGWFDGDMLLGFKSKRCTYTQAQTKAAAESPRVVSDTDAETVPC